MAQSERAKARQDADKTVDETTDTEQRHRIRRRCSDFTGSKSASSASARITAGDSTF
jgi:hypothetical protein